MATPNQKHQLVIRCLLWALSQIYQKTLSAPIWVHFSASGLYQKCSFELPMSVLLRLLCSAQIVCIVPHEPAGKSQIKYKYLQERNATTKGTSKAPMCALSRVLCKLHIYIFHSKHHRCAVPKAVEETAMSHYKLSVAICAFLPCVSRTIQNNAYIYVHIFYSKRHRCAVSKSCRSWCHVPGVQNLFGDIFFLRQRVFYP